MAITIMPTHVVCCRCKQTFPVKGVMSLVSGGRIPLLVVLPEVTSAEEALTNATCQVCLKKTGSPERALTVILAALGCDEPAESSLVLPTRRSPSVPTLDLAALVRSKARDRGPSMAGVRVVMPERPRRDAVRPPPRREPRIDDKPRIPKALQPPEWRESDPKVEPLKVGLDEKSIAALEAARPAARVRDEAKKRSRFGKFGARMKKLKHLLVFIRGHADLGDMDEEIKEYRGILSEAIDLDPKQRGRQGLLSRLGTSESELEDLLAAFWTTHTIIPKKDGGDGGGEEGSQAVSREPRSHVKGVRLVQGELNPFPGGCRPRHFDGEMNEGRQVALLPVVVVQAQSSLPTPNAPRGEPEDPRPKIVYPQAERYGKTYTVKGSKQAPKPVLVMTKARAKIALCVWSADHPDGMVPYTNDPVGGVRHRVEIPLLDLLCLYLEPYLQQDETMDEGVVSSKEAQPHAEV
ncbi:hypothetical protein HZA87_05725 [Candidatus Uhrbacteria bacterium]|nr:hypothetical protein [Candidatus Uhrbacteria bacterium]